MTLQELRNQLKSLQNTNSGQLRLSASAFDATPIQGLLETVLQVNALEIRNTDKLKTTRKKQVVTQGVVDLWGLSSAPVRLSFGIIADEPSLALTIDLPANWKFSDSFSALANTIFDEVVLGNDITPCLIASTHDHAHEAPALEVKEGLSFHGVIDTAGNVFTKIGWMLDDAESSPLSGTIDLLGSQPEIDLVLPETSLSGLFSDRSLPVKMALRATEFPDLPGLQTGIEISSALELGDTSIQLSTLIPRGEIGVILLSGDFDGVAFPSPAEIAALFGASDILDILPSELQDTGLLSLSHMEIAIGSRTKKLEYVNATLGVLTGKSLEVIPELVAVEEIAVEMSVYAPFDSSNRSVVSSLSGVIQLDEVALDVVATAPHYNVYAELQDETPIGLHKIVQYFAPEFTDIPQLDINTLGLAASPTDKVISFDAELATDWHLSLGNSELALENLIFSLTMVTAGDQQVNGSLRGYFALADTSIEIEAALQDTLVFRGTIPEIGLHALVEEFAPDVTIPDEVPHLDFADIDFVVTPKTGEFSFSGSSSTPWEIPIGIDGLSISDITVDIQRSRDASEDAAVSGSIEGTINIGNASFRVAYAFPGELVLGGKIPTFNLSPLIQDLCGPDAIRGLPVPISILELELNDLDVTIAPKSRSLSISASSPIGKTEAIIKRTSDGSWGFSLGIAPPETWRFSEIDPVLVVLNPLKFSSTALIVASSEDRSFALTTIDTPNTDTSIKRGLNFFATLDMRGLGVDDLLGIEALTVYAAIGSSPKNLVIEAQIAGQFQLADNVAFGDIKFRLQPSPTDFAVTLLGTVITTIDDSPLRFTGGLGIRAIVTPPSFQARLQATMLGRWNNPMGAEGLAVADVALDLAIGFPPLRPSIGLAGTLQVGDFQGSVAVKIDTINPSQSMLAVAFNRLYLMDVIQTFTPPAVHQSIPQSIAQTVLDVGFEDVDIYIVPQPTSIGELFFEQGISLKGTMSIWGIRAFGYLSIDQTSGVLVEADVDEINIGGLFKLSGAGRRENAYLYLDLRLGGRPSIDISAAIELLGLRREVQLNISDEGFYFQMSGAIFNLFEASLEVRGGSLDNGDGIFVKASMRNDLFAYLREEATKAIQAAADDAVAELEEAQRTLSDAQREIQRINGSIDSMRRTVERERARDIKRLQDAQQAVSRAQAEVQRLDREIQHMRQLIQQERNRDIARIRSARDEVQRAQNKGNGLDRQIQSMRQTIRNERASSERDIRNARNEVQKAQNTVNTLQGEINSTKRAISRIDDQIRAKKRWLDGKKWWDKTWAGPEYAAYEAAKRIEQGALYTKIGGIEAAKHTAVGALEVAKQVLRGIEAGAKMFPIDADPRVAGLFAARETANLALEAAKQVLRGIEAGAKTFPIDADPRVAGLFAARETANLALEAAKQVVHGIELAAINVPVDADPRIAALFAARETANGALEVAKLGLEGVKQSVGGLAEVGQYIVDFGLGGLLDIREASFEGSLTATNGGHVMMGMTLSFMGDPHTLILPFNFHDPLSSAKALAESLLPS